MCWKSVLDVGRFALLLTLGVLCTVASMACLTAVCVASPLLAEQMGAWLAHGAWTPFPLSALLEQIAYRPHSDWRPLQVALARLLSLEAGPSLIFGAAAIYGSAVWMFHSAVRRAGISQDNDPAERSRVVVDMRAPMPSR